MVLFDESGHVSQRRSFDRFDSTSVIPAIVCAPLSLPIEQELVPRRQSGSDVQHQSHRLLQVLASYVHATWTSDFYLFDINMLMYKTIASLAYIASTAHALPSLLVFSATTGFRHESIPTAIEVLRSAASDQNVTFEFTE